ncbi:MAG: YbhB/YbcL family Raf kinase inhibitor-like protein [Candidatus Heimdallarchaeota archaeon]|nr:YbhB/YbcL family Raf kinase inhibitor-like protein [Candidatus Heimdallarchaeota archaeon]
MKITSPIFEHNQDIPKKYTCQGEDVNPPLNIHDVPPKTKSLVLIMDDPDAPMGVWDHWIVWNISPEITKIEENSTPEGAIVGKNSWNKKNYGGPCPPSKKHRYFFKLYALDTQLKLKANQGKKAVEKAMKDHILEQTELVGLYQKT